MNVFYYSCLNQQHDAVRQSTCFICYFTRHMSGSVRSFSKLCLSWLALFLPSSWGCIVKTGGWSVWPCHRHGSASLCSRDRQEILVLPPRGITVKRVVFCCTAVRADDLKLDNIPKCFLISIVLQYHSVLVFFFKMTPDIPLLPCFQLKCHHASAASPQHNLLHSVCPLNLLQPFFYETQFATR